MGCCVKDRSSALERLGSTMSELHQSFPIARTRSTDSSPAQGSRQAVSKLLLDDTGLGRGLADPRTTAPPKQS